MKNTNEQSQNKGFQTLENYFETDEEMRRVLYKDVTFFRAATKTEQARRQ